MLSEIFTIQRDLHTAFTGNIDTLQNYAYKTVNDPSVLAEGLVKAFKENFMDETKWDDKEFYQELKKAVDQINNNDPGNNNWSPLTKFLVIGGIIIIIFIVGLIVFFIVRSKKVNSSQPIA